MRQVASGIICAALGYLGGSVSERISANLLGPESKVIAIVDRDIARPAAPFVCSVGQLSSLVLPLKAIGIDPSPFDGIRTADDENMILVFDGRRLTGIQFTTFKHRLPEERCFRTS
jgi:hypothetical protein